MCAVPESWKNWGWKTKRGGGRDIMLSISECYVIWLNLSKKKPVPSKTLAHWRANDDHVVGLNFSGNGILLLRMKCCRSGSLTFYVTISRGGSVVSSFGSSKSCNEKCVPVSFSIWWVGLLMRSGACRKTRPTTTQLTAAIFCAITCRIEPTEKRRASTSFFFLFLREFRRLHFERHTKIS